MLSDAAVRKALRRATADGNFLEARWEEFVAQYPNKWVGVHQKTAIFADSLEALLRLASEQEWDLGTMVVDRLIEKRPAALL